MAAYNIPIGNNAVRLNHRTLRSEIPNRESASLANPTVTIKIRKGI
jgi:hypothetical protein